MRLFFWEKKKKEEPKPNFVSSDKDVLGAIRYVVDKNEDKYLHINDFIALLTEYQKKCKDYTQVALLAQIITELKKA
jgi:hypothetical protein